MDFFSKVFNGNVEFQSLLTRPSTTKGWQKNISFLRETLADVLVIDKLFEKVFNHQLPAPVFWIGCFFWLFHLEYIAQILLSRTELFPNKFKTCSVVWSASNIALSISSKDS